MDSMRYFMIAGTMVGVGVGIWKARAYDINGLAVYVIAGALIGAGVGSLLWQFA